MMRTVEKILSDNAINTPENLACVNGHASPLNLAKAFELLTNYDILDKYRDAIINAKTPLETAKAIAKLETKSEDLNTHENLEILCQIHNPKEVTEAWLYLYDAQLFEQYQEAVSTHADPIFLSMGLITLHQKNLQKHAHHLFNSNEPSELADALYHLNCYHILEDNAEFVIHHAHPHDLAQALTTLSARGVLEDYKTYLIARDYPSNLADAIAKLNTYNPLILQQFRHFLLASTKPSAFVDGVKLLNQAGLLEAVHVERIHTNAFPQNMAKLLIILTQANLLSEANTTAVEEHENFNNLCQTLSILAQSQLLTEERFNFIVQGTGQVLVTDDVMRHFWNRIPTDLLAEHWQTVVGATTHPNTMETLVHLREIINEEARLRHAIVLLDEVGPADEHPINHRQSTHLSSVHRSVSESACRLRERYYDGIDIETVIQTIQEEVNALNDSHRHQVAKRAILRLCAPIYTFTDNSGVSTRELLALIYTAINDDETRLGLREDGFSRFIDALYEIQRGYNIEANEPETAPDSAICSAGTFNKLIEKMVGVHPDAILIFINAQTAGLRLERYAQVEAMTYLRALAASKTMQEFTNFIRVLKGIEANGFDFIFTAFAINLAQHFFPEYEALYPQGKDDPRFLELIAIARDFDLNEDQKHLLRQELTQSQGYHAYCSKALRPSSIHSFWARRQDNPLTQHQYDKHYGIIIK